MDAYRKIEPAFTIEKHGSYDDHLMRAAQFHLVQLSTMADMKANMLLTMSSVVLSLTLPQLFRNAQLWPLLILVAFCLLTVCLAAYAVMPKLPPNTGEVPDVNNPNFNPLFFGDFTCMTQQHFEKTMEEIMNDPSRTYGAQVRELYLLGTFLARKKYRFLRLGYISFIIGLFASSVGFVIVALR
jgi:hypothetical protein